MVTKRSSSNIDKHSTTLEINSQSTWTHTRKIFDCADVSGVAHPAWRQARFGISVSRVCKMSLGIDHTAAHLHRQVACNSNVSTLLSKCTLRMPSS